MPTPPDFDDAVRAAFSEFHVQLPELGRGTFKVAYRIQDSSQDRVLKVLLEPVDIDVDEYDSASVSDRFSRELEGMSAIRSPHVVQILTQPELRMIGSDNHVFYMEPFYPGGTLRQRIAAGPLSVEETIRLGLDLLHGVESLWEPHQIVHRDIKPGNIVFDSDGNAVLLDLGIALYLTLSELTDSSLSSPRTDRYSAPEQFEVRRAATIDFRTDLFLVGMVLFEALTGNHPFLAAGLNPGQYLDRLENYDSSSLAGRGIPVELQQVIARLLAGKPSRRFRTVQEPIALLESVS